MKVLKTLVILGIIVIVGGFFALQMAPGFISSTLSKKMQVEVKINDISLSTNDVRVDELEIGNPKGSKLPKAFSAGSIKVEAPVLNYVKDAIVIDEIAVDKIYLSLEIANPTAPAGNWAKIMDNLKKSSPQAPKEKKETKSTSSILIKKLILTDISADLATPLKVSKLAKIDRLEFTDISSESGVSIDQIVALVLEETVTAVLKENGMKNVFDNVLESSKGVLDVFTSPFK